MEFARSARCTRYKYRKYTQQQKLKQNHLERKWVCLSVLNSPSEIRTLFCSVTSLKFSGKWTASKNTTNLLVSLPFTSINKSFFIAWLTEMFTLLYYTKYSARNNINIVAKLPHTRNHKMIENRIWSSSNGTIEIYIFAVKFNGTFIFPSNWIVPIV